MTTALYWTSLQVEPGRIGIVADNDALVRLYFCTVSLDPAKLVAADFPISERQPSLLIDEIVDQLGAYFAGRLQAFRVPLSQGGQSPFQRRVLAALREVPYGDVVSYGRLAELAGVPGAARAVGSVMARNPFPIIVPCHRVVCADGRLGAYSGASGRSTKAWLIEFERRNH